MDAAFQSFEEDSTHLVVRDGVIEENHQRLVGQKRRSKMLLVQSYL